MPVKQQPVKDDFWAGTSAPAQNEQAAPAENEDWKVWQDQGEQTAPADNSVTAIRPHQSDTLPHALEDVFGNIGAGGLGTLATLGRLTALPDLVSGNPTIYGELIDAFKNPKETGKSLQATGKDILKHPFENIEGAIGAAGAGALIPEGAEAVNALPSKARAAQALRAVETAAKDVPVGMTMTDPAVQGFRDFVNTGGRNARVMTKLGKRLDTGEPMNFPEARQFYSNVSEMSARPGVFRRAIESPSAPKMRYQLGGVRQAMNQDLTNAAESVGMGDKYTQALREYANAARLNKVLKAGGLLGAGEAARRTGLLGNWIHRTALQQ